MKTRIGSPCRTLIVGPRCAVLLGRDGRRTLPAADDDSRGAAARERARAAEDRQQDRGAEAREEVAVDLSADARLTGEIRGGRSKRDRHAVGTNQPGPHEVGAALAGLGRALVFADQPRRARDQDAAAVERLDVLADDRADIAGHVGVDRGFEDGWDQRALDRPCSPARQAWWSGRTCCRWRTRASQAPRRRASPERQSASRGVFGPAATVSTAWSCRQRPEPARHLAPCRASAPFRGMGSCPARRRPAGW